MHRKHGLCAAITGVVLALAGGFVNPVAAANETESHTMAVVRQLNLQEGRGWLTVQVNVYTTSYSGFDVRIPAGDGEWSADAVRPVPELGVVCREAPGPGLHYRCGETEGTASNVTLPRGGYQVAFRVQHTGHPDGLIGRSSMYHPDWDLSVYRMSPDVFPVYEQPHSRSTAEVALAHGDNQDNAAAMIPVSVAVMPGEVVTALDVRLPSTYSWRITGSNARRRGLQCFVRSAAHTLHCRPAIGATRFWAGRYVVTVHLALTGSSDWRAPRDFSAALTVDGDPHASYDDFGWRDPYPYGEF